MLPEYAIFRRRLEGYWQSIAGGGEEGESPLEAIRREAFEEAGIPADRRFLELQTRASAPVIHFRHRDHWDPALFVVPIYYFGVELSGAEIRLSREHSAFQWLPYEQAASLLKWDGDRTALWELDQILLRAQRG